MSRQGSSPTAGFRLKRLHIAMPGILCVLFTPWVAFGFLWEDAHVTNAPYMYQILQFPMAMACMLPVLASNILAGAFDRIFDISFEQAAAGDSPYFLRFTDAETGKTVLRGDLSLLPAASRFGWVEWFLYALGGLYLVELSVVVGRSGLLTDPMTSVYAGSSLAIVMTIMVLLKYFIQSISVAILKREQDLAYEYVRGFRQRLYGVTFCQFVAFGYTIVLANATPVLLPPIASFAPDPDGHCAAITPAYLSANCTPSMMLASPDGYLCRSDGYSGVYRSAFDACMAARAQPLYLAQSIAVLLISTNAVLFLLFSELPRFRKEPGTTHSHVGMAGGQGDGRGDGKGSEQDGLLTGPRPEPPVQPAAHGVFDRLLRSHYTRHVGKLLVVAALLVCPFWAALLLVGPRHFQASHGRVSWVLSSTYSGFFTAFNLGAWMLSLICLHADVVYRNSTNRLGAVKERLIGVLDTRPLLGSTLAAPSEDSTELSAIRERAARERAQQVCTFTFVRAAAIDRLPGISLPRHDELVEHHKDALEEQTISLERICAGRSYDEILVVSHRWEESQLPDPYGKQREAIVEYLRAHPAIRLVWYDYSCLAQEAPQRQRSAVQLADFSRQLLEVNKLYLGCEVLLIVDLQYFGRFWTQLETWLSMQKCDGGRMVPLAPTDRRRYTLRGIHSAGKSIEDVLERDWANRSWRQAIDVLGRPDVFVTNQRDKGQQLQKIEALVRELEASFKVAPRVVAHQPAIMSGPAAELSAAEVERQVQNV